MAAITVGVPVFNEAARLPRCLEILRAQTFTDFEVLIFDNASDDATGEIAKAFCAHDRRFRYVRNPTNLGAIPNHHAVLRAAQSPYFVWRAADDSSDLNYLEALYAVLEADPTKALAVGRDIGTARGEVIRTTLFPKLKNDGKLGDTWRLMSRSPPSWFYGLYRREVLAPVVDRIAQTYTGWGWAYDYLVLLPFFMDDAVAGTDATSFAAALRPRRGEGGKPAAPRTEADLDMMLSVRRQFLDIAQTFVDERIAPGPGRALWAGLLRLYADRRVYKTKHILRRSARRLVGLTP